MGWEKEYEHFCDKGRTWGPGVDAVEPLTDEEKLRQDALMEAFSSKIKAYSVAPRQEFVEAGVKLKELAQSRDFPRDEYSKKKIEFCTEVCKSLGYSLELDGFYSYLQNNDIENTFSVSVEYHGWLPGRGGNVHKYFVCGIKDVEDCLQLVADFSAIGAIPTTWFGKDFHYSTRNTGELRNEFIKQLGIGQLDNVESMHSFDDTLSDAVERSRVNDNEKCDYELDL